MTLDAEGHLTTDGPRTLPGLCHCPISDAHVVQGGAPDDRWRPIPPPSWPTEGIAYGAGGSGGSTTSDAAAGVDEQERLRLLSRYGRCWCGAPRTAATSQDGASMHRILTCLRGHEAS